MTRILVMDRAGRFYTGNGRFNSYHVHEALKFKSVDEAKHIASLYNATVEKV